MPSQQDFAELRAKTLQSVRGNTEEFEKFPTASNLALAWQTCAHSLLQNAAAGLGKIEENTLFPGFLDPRVKILATGASEMVRIAHTFLERADDLERLTKEGVAQYAVDIETFGSEEGGTHNLYTFADRTKILFQIRYADIFECLPDKAMRPSSRAKAVTADDAPTVMA